MYSFRPDAESTHVGFVPTPLFAARAPELLEATDGPAPPVIDEPATEPEVAPAELPTAEEIAALEQAAFERGVESARAEQQALQATCRTMDEAIAAWRATTSSLLTANRTQVLDLARELVAHWLQAELATESGRYADYLDRALEGVRADEEVRILVSEADLARLEANAPEALERWRSGGASVATDPALAEASFRIDTAAAAIEGDLDVLADRLRALLDPAVSAEAPASPVAQEGVE
jgi:flagellar biosynthesis/type III secretory pathway protein FliH